MATYERNQGQVSSSSSNLPALPSRDIGSILVRSLQTALGNEDGGDDDLSDKIADGINKSDLVKGSKGGVSKKTGAASVAKSPIDNLLQAEETKRTKSYEKHLKSQEAEEKKAREERKRRDQSIERAFDATLKGLSTFAQNPLKGFDNMLQGGFKLAFKGLDRAFTAIPFLKNKNGNGGGKDGNGGNSKNAEVLSPAELKKTLLESFTASKEFTAIAKVVGDESNFQKNIAYAIEHKNSLSQDKFHDNLKKELEAEKAKSNGKTKGEKDKQEAKEATVEKKRDKQAGDQLAAVKTTNVMMGKIVGIGALAGVLLVTMPLIKMLIAKLVIGVSNFIKDLPAKFKVASVVLSTAIQKILVPLFSKIPGYSALSDEDKAQKKELEKRLSGEYGELGMWNATKAVVDKEKKLETLKGMGDSVSEEDLKKAEEEMLDARRRLGKMKKTLKDKGAVADLEYLEILDKEAHGVNGMIASLEEKKNTEVAKIWEDEARSASMSGRLTAARFEHLKQKGNFSEDFVKEIESRGFAQETKMESWERTGAEYGRALLGTGKQLKEDVFGDVSVNKWGPGAKNDVRVNTTVYNQSNPNMGN